VRPSSPTSPPSRQPRQAPPSTARTGRPPPPTKGAGAAPAETDLSLAISRAGLGLELGAPLALGPLTLHEMTASLPHVRFPIDVSGGVARFRSRRGVLERLVLEAPRAALEAWVAPKLRGLLGVGTPRVMLYVRRGGATVGVLDATGDGHEARCLAFEVELEAGAGADGADLALSVHDARGVALAGPPTALAVRALHAALGGLAERSGARFVIPRAAAELARRVFPDRGARAPLVLGAAWATVRGHDESWLLVLQRGETPAEPTAAAVVARESCLLARGADDAAFELDFERARGLLVGALERAPRHPELARRLAELDRAIGAGEGGHGSRAEAALATLRDRGATAAPAEPLLLAELLSDTGDADGAIAAFTRAEETEPVGPLAALACVAGAALTADPLDAMLMLDRAVARAPALPSPRWARLERRLAVGRVADARADAEHLEALSSGARARHAVWLRAGQAFRAAGWSADAGPLFERALRYAPRDADATAGLGAALVAVGKVARGAELLTQAVALAEARPKGATGGAWTDPWRAHVDLAAVLAEKLDDRPAAIARLREVPAHANVALAARALEGRYRGLLGDVAGASLAFAKARDLVDTRLAEMSGDRAREAVAVLLEAAHLDGEVKGDWLAAQRHLLTALRVAPRDEAVRLAYRAASARVARPDAGDPAASSAPGHAYAGSRSPESAPTWTSRDPADSQTTATDDGDAEEQARDDARAAVLLQRLQADPNDDAVADELAGCLLRLGRTHELFALLSARLDEATPTRREALLPRQREVLRRLETDARAAGRDDEASLYAEMRQAL
jgi:tetratricopeptide (TPR) repeat protein